MSSRRLRTICHPAILCQLKALAVLGAADFVLLRERSAHPADEAARPAHQCECRLGSIYEDRSPLLRGPLAWHPDTRTVGALSLRLRHLGTGLASCGSPRP